MKNSRNLVIFALSTLFLLAACATSPSPQQEANERDLPQPGRTLYAEGLTCDLIQAAQQKDQCKAQVNNVVGALLENEVISRFDLDRCKELENKIGTNCQNALANTGVQGPVSDEELTLFSQAVQGVIPVPEPAAGPVPPTVRPVLDPSACAKLTTPGYKEFCEAEIAQRMGQELLNEILSSGDQSRCNELSEDMKTQCEQLFGLVELPEPPVPPVGETFEPVNPPLEQPTTPPAE